MVQYGHGMEEQILQQLEQGDEVPAEVVIVNEKKKSMLRDDKDNDMILLDKLKCCLSFKGDATDENTLILCSGAGCFQAYHMQCVSLHITNVGEEDEDDNWVCPLCTCVASLLAYGSEICFKGTNAMDENNSTLCNGAGCF
jgi:hypothetical protein